MRGFLRSPRAEPTLQAWDFFAGGLLASPRVRFFRPPKATELFAYCQTQTRAHWLGIHCATMPQCWIVLGVNTRRFSLERDTSPGSGKRSRQNNALRTSEARFCYRAGTAACEPEKDEPAVKHAPTRPRQAYKPTQRTCGVHPAKAKEEGIALSTGARGGGARLPGARR